MANGQKDQPFNSKIILLQKMTTDQASNSKDHLLFKLVVQSRSTNLDRPWSTIHMKPQIHQSLQFSYSPMLFLVS